MLLFLALILLVAPAFSQEFKFPGRYIFCIKEKMNVMETPEKDLRRFKEKLEEMFVNRQMFQIFNPERMNNKLLTESEFVSQKVTGPTHIIFYWLSVNFKERMAGGEFFLEGLLYIEKLRGSSLTGAIWKRVSGRLRSQELGLKVESKDDLYNREVCIDKLAERLAGRMIQELAKDIKTLEKDPSGSTPFGTANAGATGNPTKLALFKSGKKNIANIGETAKFVAKIYDENGRPLNLPLLWTVLGSNQAGKLASDFAFTADKSGDYVIKVVEPKSGLEKTYFLRVEWPKVSKIEIDLLNTTLLAGQKIRIAAKAYDDKNELIANCPVEWKTNGGTIADDIFTASVSPGIYKIMVRDKGNQAESSVKVKVILVQPSSEPAPKVAPPRTQQETVESEKSQLMKNLHGKILSFQANKDGYWYVKYQITNQNSVILSNMLVVIILSDNDKKELGRWNYTIRKNYPPNVPVVITKKWLYNDYPRAQYINAHVTDFVVGSSNQNFDTTPSQEDSGFTTVTESDFGGSYQIRTSWKKQVTSSDPGKKEVAYLVQGTDAAVMFLMLKNTYLTTAFFQAIDKYFQSKGQTDTNGPCLQYSFSKSEKQYIINGLAGKLISYSGYSANFIGYKAEYFFSQQGNLAYVTGFWAQEGVFDLYAPELRKAMHSLRQTSSPSSSTDSGAFTTVYESSYHSSYQVDPNWVKKVTANQPQRKSDPLHQTGRCCRGN